MLMKNIKMLVTDLDRTLLRTDKTISDYTAGILNKCRQNGIKIVFATARPERAAAQFLEQVRTDAVIIHNGALIYADGEKIFHCGIPPGAAKNILHRISRDFPDATLSVEIDDVFYANFEIADYKNDTYSIVVDFSDFEKISAGLPDKPAEKIIIGMRSINMPPESDIKYFDKYLTDDLYLEMDSGRFIMIMNRKTKKSLAVKMLAERYGYDMSEVAAFGDDFNDVEMLKECGVGVAAANAIDEAKIAADFICESNDNDGVAKWIEENIL